MSESMETEVRRISQPEVEFLKLHLRIARIALWRIAAEAVPLGYDSGHSTIYRLAHDALIATKTEVNQ